MRRFGWVLIGCLAGFPAAARAEEMAPNAQKPATAPAEKSKQTPKLYRFKGQRTSGSGEGQSVILSVQDLISGKSESLFLASGDPALAEAVKNLAPGTAVDVVTERRKGRPTVVAVNMAPLVPGEDRPNVYVL